mgnify:CR=1 FL=1
MVECADWKTVTEGCSAEDASTKAFEKMMEIRGKDLQVSPVIKTVCLSEVMEDFDLEQYMEYCSCSMIMSNAGYHESAKMLNNIVNSNNENIRN